MFSAYSPNMLKEENLGQIYGHAAYMKSYIFLISLLNIWFIHAQIENKTQQNQKGILYNIQQTDDNWKTWIKHRDFKWFFSKNNDFTFMLFYTESSSLVIIFEHLDHSIYVLILKIVLN